MSLVFFVIGCAISSLVPVSIVSNKLFSLFAGVLMLVLGINNLGLLERLRSVQAFFNKLSDGSDALNAGMISTMQGDNKYLSAFVFGVFISIALGPCSLALVLPAVMMTLFNAPTALHGGLQLMAFGFGHSVPVLLLSVLLTQSRIMLSEKLIKFGKVLNTIFGVGAILLGVWLVMEVM